MANWCELDYDVLGEIVLKLDTIEDFLYFSIVCRSWNRASSMVKHKWNSSMPSLFLTENTTKNTDLAFPRKFFSLGNNRCYQLNVPHAFGARCWGSTCDGWVITIDLSLQIHMYNPITNARLRLPPLPNQDPPLDEEYIICERLVSIRKAVVVKKDVDDWVVLAMHGNWKRFLSFARPGDVTWTSIHPPWGPRDDILMPPFSHRAADVVCSSDGLILILYEDASVGCLDLSDLNKSSIVVKAKEFMKSPELKNRLNKHLHEMYLVTVALTYTPSAAFGKLLMVLRQKSNVWDYPDSKITEDEIYKTDGFEVFGVDSERGKWEEVRELGDVALFVGDNQSVSVRASDCRNCRSDCIYFTDDCVEFWERARMFGGHDMGVFDLKDGNIHRFYQGDDDDDDVHSDVCTPFWFMPHF